MGTERIKLTVFVDRDIVPAGTFHTRERARDIVIQILNERIPNHHPSVSVTHWKD